MTHVFICKGPLNIASDLNKLWTLISISKGVRSTSLGSDDVVGDAEGLGGGSYVRSVGPKKNLVRAQGGGIEKNTEMDPRRHSDRRSYTGHGQTDRATLDTDRQTDRQTDRATLDIYKPHPRNADGQTTIWQGHGEKICDGARTEGGGRGAEQGGE